MNEKNGIEESKPKQSRRQGESAPYAVESLAVNRVLTILAFDSLRTILDSN